LNRYTVNYLFDDYGSNVALIQKARPSWQAGKWNGIGGKVNEGETPFEATVREFKEETGVEEFFWKHYATVKGKEPDREGEFTVYYYKAFNTRSLSNVRWITDEVVALHHVNSLPKDLVQHVKWMIPLALYSTGVYTIEEQ
jgi:8-oxo-dGTP diphosphatase